MLKVSLPFEEQLAHFVLIGRTWTSLASTPNFFAQALTSALKTSRGTVSSKGLNLPTCAPLTMRPSSGAAAGR